jgi:cytoskeletal protein RodZ
MNQDKNDTKKKKKGAVAPEGERRSMPKKERSRRGLFLIADVVLLAVIVAAIFFMVSLLTPFSLFDNNKDEARTVTYTVEFKGVEKDAFASLRKGDTVVDKATGAVVGVVTDLEPRKYVVYTDVPTAEKDETLDSHVVTRTEYPEEFTTVSVTVTVTADYAEGVGYSVDGCRIAVGREYELNFPGCAGKGVCVEFKAE